MTKVLSLVFYFEGGLTFRVNPGPLIPSLVAFPQIFERYYFGLWFPFFMHFITSKLQRFTLYTVDVIYGRRGGVRAQLYGAFLYVFSLLFSFISQVRYWLYRKRILQDQPLGCLVVVVGNLTVGGTGKTPVVEKLARSLNENGRKVAILTRGYKSKEASGWRKWWRRFTHSEGEIVPRIVSDGERVLLDPTEAGDEPYMLAKNLPGVIVLVDRNRVNSGAYAIKHFKVDTLILDDGFQYLPLKGSLNLLLVDKTNPFGNGYMLPRGILREPVKHLKRASYIFLTKSDGRPDPGLEKRIRRHHPEVEMIECIHQPKYLKCLRTGEEVPLSTIHGKRIGAFSGIAVPESFEGFLRKLGAHLFFVRRFLDHHRFTPDELSRLFDDFARADLDYLLTTEKDAVRIPPDTPIPPNLYFLRLEIEIIAGLDNFDEVVKRICVDDQQLEASSSLPSL